MVEKFEPEMEAGDRLEIMKRWIGELSLLFRRGK
jgi:hypothetical protein